MTFPLPWIREQFPALRSDTIFLDNAAGAQVPQQVIDHMIEAMTQMQVNKGGLYAESIRVTEAKEHVREQVRTFLDAPHARNVIFGPNATTLLTLLSEGFARHLEAGDEVIITGLDHHSNRDPWRKLQERGITTRTWEPTGETHTLELSDLDKLLTDRTRLVSMTAASNALGTLTDVAGAARRVHAAGAKLVVDAVHYAPHYLPDVQAWGADALVFSPYKVYGPHLGILYLSDELLDTLPNPGLSFFPGRDPILWEPGTQNHEAIHAFGGTFAYFKELAEKLELKGSDREVLQGVFQATHAHDQELATRLHDGLQALNAVVYGPSGTGGRTATFSFTLPGYTARKVAEHLASQGVAVASGHYYAYDLMMNTLNLRDRGGAVRVSALHYNTLGEIEQFLAALALLA